VIGARFDDQAGGISAGSAYVFVRAGGVWTQRAKLTASDAAAYDEFGCSVSLSGDTAVIGAVWDDYAGLENAGSAYVFDLACSLPGDLDADGDVDFDDRSVLIDVLLGTDTDPQHLAAADLNHDNVADGLDIQQFIEALLAG
jgi:hypothetical protein